MPEQSTTIPSVAGAQPVMNGCRDAPGMLPIPATALRPGISVGRSRQWRAWHPEASSPERCLMPAAGPASKHSSSPRWGCRFWAWT